ncbi:hypothetical protein A2706_00060 [Candidatus Peribacteria bacterium RIFCSPHIGHO2_01_FULL_51_35]|nr:MAG: hypothetical protein A2706_00060 [Candidatus Peribacteria bacterium RIFCSPHIGHO2_01_FULL_51_35]
MPRTKTARAYVASPAGWIEITAEEDAITGIRFADHPRKSDASPLLRDATRQLQDFMKGKRRTFTLNLMKSGSPFQKSVWKELTNVRFGERISYSELARRLKKPTATRAVASAVAKNPFGIVVPCHRVVPARGNDAGNYAWGKKRKEWLLMHEDLPEK